MGGERGADLARRQRVTHMGGAHGGPRAPRCALARRPAACAATLAVVRACCRRQRVEGAEARQDRRSPERDLVCSVCWRAGVLRQRTIVGGDSLIGYEENEPGGRQEGGRELKGPHLPRGRGPRQNSGAPAGVTSPRAKERPRSMHPAVRCTGLRPAARGRRGPGPGRRGAQDRSAPSRPALPAAHPPSRVTFAQGGSTASSAR